MQHRQPRRGQPDLFSSQLPPPSLPPAVRQRVLPLVGELLQEAARPLQEADHEDHA